MDLSLGELNKLADEAERVDKSHFSEQRNNVLLVSGQHYTKRSREEFESRINAASSLSQTQKIRLTMNHIQKATRLIEEYILEQAPSVKCFPQNERETQDVKSAELHNSVLEDIKRQIIVDVETTDDVSDFVTLGEVGCKWFYDPQMGEYLGDFPRIGADGQPEVDEAGQPVMEPKFSGQMVAERLYGFNTLRPPGCTNILKAPWLIVRKMMPKKDLIAKLKDQPDVVKKIKESSSWNQSFLVFDTQAGDYRMSQDEVLVKEIYVRKCQEYKNGYYKIWIPEVELFEGELPGGIFPIAFQLYEKLPTYPRGVSQIRHGRPYQAEMNRCASKIAEHQITLGDDKLVTFNNSKVTKGADLPGVRHINVGGQGQAPTVIQGRNGSQYMEYYLQKEREFYDIMMLPEEGEQKGQTDPFAMLLKRARQKKRFSKYATKFEAFLVEKYRIALEIYRYSVPEEAVIPVIGRQEQVNITEFKNSKPTQYQIKLEPTSADLDGQYAKQLVLQQIIQYTGGNLNRDDLGKLIRAMPFLSKEQVLSDMTLQYDTATNVVLALDRGEQPPITDGEQHPYMIQRLNYRMTLSDFRLLPEPVQQNYKLRLVEHEKIMAEQQMLEARLKQGLIPTSGPLIGVDFYVTDETNATRTRRARIPMDAIRWLIDSLTKQGMLVQQMSAIPANARAHIGAMIQAPQPQGGMSGAEPGNQQPVPGQFNGTVGVPGAGNAPV